MSYGNESTAPNTSVGADEGRSHNQVGQNITDPDLDFKENREFFKKVQSAQTRVISIKEQKNTQVSALQTVSMNELYDRVFSSRPSIIDGLLYLGVYLLAGAPKVGKSFMVAQIAYHVSMGIPLWDRTVQKGTVLYLALEDNYKRLQDRMSRMFGVEGTEDLHFAVYAQQVSNGLEEQMEQFLKSYPETRLIIIDTLQKVRELSAADGVSYADDYQVISRFKLFADTHEVCVLLVHHTRKTMSEDRFNMISGTTGLLGCADGALVLFKSSRTENRVSLDITGRDQQDQRLNLVRDKEHLTWEFDSEETEEQIENMDPLLNKVAALLTEEEPAWEGNATALVGLLQEDIQPNILTRRLNVQNGVLRDKYGIQYTVQHTRNGSLLCLKKAEGAGMV